MRFSGLPFSTTTTWSHPTRVPAEAAIPGDLADDLLDVYLDLKEGVATFDAGYPRHAVWLWRFGFEVHWGHHATSALRALHCHLTDRERA